MYKNPLNYRKKKKKKQRGFVSEATKELFFERNRKQDFFQKKYWIFKAK